MPGSTGSTICTRPHASQTLINSGYRCSFETSSSERKPPASGISPKSKKGRTCCAPHPRQESFRVLSLSSSALVCSAEASDSGIQRIAKIREDLTWPVGKGRRPLIGVPDGQDRRELDGFDLRPECPIEFFDDYRKSTLSERPREKKIGSHGPESIGDVVDADPEQAPADQIASLGDDPSAKRN